MRRTRHPLITHLVSPRAIETWGGGFSLSLSAEHGFQALGRTGGLTRQHGAGVVVARDMVGPGRLCSHERECGQCGQGTPNDGSVGEEHQAGQRRCVCPILQHQPSLCAPLYELAGIKWC